MAKALAVIIATAKPIQARADVVLDSERTSNEWRTPNPPPKTTIPPTNCPICTATHELLLAYSINTRGWLAGSSLPGWSKVDTITITTPTRNATDPILSEVRLRCDFLHML